ncbi:hypothetical protein EPA93_31910 [Ktedonosporobacter rubrisoli]|uniref:Uncharacterized protein n=1 Tax=Ktedonosporobacter rubrisoli TaxID=2509675 RepID=A0A4P6JX64_KTERU|nr:hypothetical protein [Ktedonosporobacter rubrisoli]QBD80329.1 hypothetical protein EPA93_31910 [Ktedonosporobacter rubrisoli]
MYATEKKKQARTNMQPRAGIGGVWDRLAGPGATAAENWVNLTWVLLFTIAALAYPLLSHLKWNFWQLLLVGLIAFDIAGGISVNASPAAKRWWNRPGQALSSISALWYSTFIPLSWLLCLLASPGSQQQSSMRLYYLLLFSFCSRR